MRVPKVTSKTNGFVVLVSVVGLVFGAAGPAAADDAVVVGAGAGTGWEYPPANPQVCTLPTEGAYFQHDTFVLSHYGTYAVVTADLTNGTVEVPVYLGPIDFIITVGPHMAGPQGVVYAPSGPNCTFPLIPAFVPGPVPITDVHVSGSTGSIDFPPQIPSEESSVECDMTGGTSGGLLTPNQYTRVSEVVVFTFTVECDISSSVLPSLLGGPVNDVDVFHVIEGTMTPCTVVPPLGYPTNPACDIRTGEEGASHLETAHEAVSVLSVVP